MWRRLRRGLGIGALLLVTACSGRETFQVAMQDSAMEPTFSARTPIAFRRTPEADRGDIVAFEYPFPYPGRPRRELIARIVGLPGDYLQLGADSLVVNGQPVTEPYAKNRDRMTAQVLVVPPRTYFVLGDDRANRRDSRWWGPLPAARLLGIYSG